MIYVCGIVLGLPLGFKVLAFVSELWSFSVMTPAFANQGLPYSLATLVGLIVIRISVSIIGKHLGEDNGYRRVYELVERATWEFKVGYVTGVLPAILLGFLVVTFIGVPMYIEAKLGSIAVWIYIVLVVMFIFINNRDKNDA